MKLPSQALVFQLEKEKIAGKHLNKKFFYLKPFFKSLHKKKRPIKGVFIF